MGNYKNIYSLVETLVKREKPFLIVKYNISFIGIASNVYEVVVFGRKNLNYLPIERGMALKAIETFHLPLLHTMDSRNAIWGDERFIEKFRKVRLKI